MQRLATALILATTLSACGGGGGNQAGSSSTTPATPSAYTLTKQTVKDFQSYNVTWQPTGGASKNKQYWDTYVTTTVNADGSYTRAEVDNAGSDRTYIDFTADGARKNVDRGCNYVFTPAYARIPGTLAVGQTWEVNSLRTCVDDSKENTAINAKGSVVAIESITVAAGTFNAIKTIGTRSSTSKTGGAVNEETCWRDTISGLELKCNVTTTTTSTGATTSVTKQTSTTELGGYAQAATGRQKLNVERFAGKWEVWFTGTADGGCSVNILASGAVTGSCHNRLGNNFDIVGTVDAAGVASFHLSSYGMSGAGFSGTFESPLKIAGTWSAGSDQGTWYMLHL